MDSGVVLAGRYRLEERLGRGGMGEVWRGVDQRLRERRIAVKIVLSDLDSDPTSVARLVREAETAALLQHPGITVVYDVGEHEGHPFFVMELLVGEDLGKLLHRHPGGLPIKTVVSLSGRLADALSAAHEQGVVHRDIKPANIMIIADGRVKICDFGISRLADATTGLTVDGRIMGTPAYMAPEQYEGREPDGRTDLYSLGCVMYAMLTGRSPFPMTQNLVALMRQHLDVIPPAPGTLRPAIPPALEGLVMALLAKDPAARPQSAAQVRAALTTLHRHPAPPPIPAMPPPGPPPPAPLPTSPAQPPPVPAASAQSHPVAGATGPASPVPAVPAQSAPVPTAGVQVDDTAARPDAGVSAGRRWLGAAALILCVAALQCAAQILKFSLLDWSQRDPGFGWSQNADGWRFTSNGYTIVLTTALIPACLLAGRIGAKRLFAAGSGTLAALCVFSELAPGDSLVLPYALLGLAGAAILATGPALLRELPLPPRLQAVGIALWCASFAIPVGVGPKGGDIGGLAWWRFLAILAAVAAVLGWAVIPHRPPTRPAIRARTAGLAAGALLTLTLGLTGRSPVVDIVTFGTAAVLIAVLIPQRPAIPSSTAVAAAVTLLAGVTAFTTLERIMSEIISADNGSYAPTWTFYLPSGLALIAGTAAAAALLRFGRTFVLGLGSGLLCLTAAGLALTSPPTPRDGLTTAAIVVGFGFGLVLTAALHTVTATLDIALQQIAIPLSASFAAVLIYFLGATGGTWAPVLPTFPWYFGGWYYAYWSTGLTIAATTALAALAIACVPSLVRRRRAPKPHQTAQSGIQETS